LTADAAARGGFPHELSLSLAVTVGHTLRMELAARNIDSAPATLEEALHSYFAVSDVRQIRIRGLMGIAPDTPDPEARRAAFKTLKNIVSVCKSVKNENLEMKYLSMGMSEDFEIAIEEGATHVRIGTALFGLRGGPPMPPPLS
jgi:uncharacterized pyridoxal phosphate-containing UPF0001 family protein